MSDNRAGAIGVLALACMLTTVGFSDAVAQWAAPGGQSGAANPFPPPPGQNNPFPPAPGAPGQSAADPFPPPPGQSRPVGPARSAAPAPRSTPFPAPGAGPGGGDPCAGFQPLRAEAEKAAGAIGQASERKATREEVCPLFQRFAAAEGRMLKFLADHQSQCGVPPDVVKTARANHAKTLNMRTQVCKAAPAAAGPSLSDALGGPILPDVDDKKPGRGIFDTLTGSPLAR